MIFPWILKIIIYGFFFNSLNDWAYLIASKIYFPEIEVTEIQINRASEDGKIQFRLCVNRYNL